jgi:hypothetical protein
MVSFSVELFALVELVELLLGTGELAALLLGVPPHAVNVDKAMVRAKTDANTGKFLFIKINLPRISNYSTQL